MGLAPVLLGMAIGLVLAVSLVRAVSADGPRVTEYKVDAPPHLTVGDHVNLSITVEADKGTQVQIAPGGIPEEMALAESAKFSTKDIANGRVRVRIELVLAPFVIGEYTMPPIKLRYRDAGGNVGELQTAASDLTIEGTVPANAPLTPRDLKPQAAIGAPPASPYELIALAGSLFAVAVALMFIAWRRLGSRVLVAAEPEPELEVLGPEDAARRALDSAGARFGAEADLAAYYAALSTTVRDYLTKRFGFPAFALTTAELQGQMVFRGIDRWQARLVAGLLEQCDAVMFAHYQPATERADADLTAAYEIIEMSRPPEEEEVATA